ncbi:50S ribosomal protein L33 [Jeotgalibacillus haloalkalitolerans]|uniref:Large ribosomal subunit protein bL33 n=1 Tax=Jeotgalibacillus haloalkalitolerans TaxID=3104292 RepID=A0ABU5KSR9_9BACL|nr:50S ribosomal protein L33 [Jeotgalibacillus sp. HH7-29]MDZ5713745.1 50S ribosomal protein L33 [Jeotgalibacillus sp. HH7-29]
MTKKTILACTECGSRNYSVPSNENRQTDRLEVKKFCRYCNAHTVHKQTV